MIVAQYAPSPVWRGARGRGTGEWPCQSLQSLLAVPKAWFTLSKEMSSEYIFYKFYPLFQRTAIQLRFFQHTSKSPGATIMSPTKAFDFTGQVAIVTGAGSRMAGTDFLSFSILFLLF